MLPVLANISRFVGRVREVLESNQPGIGLPKEVFFQPYLELLRSLARTRGLDCSGLDVLTEFASIWDAKSHRFLRGEETPLSFSSAEVERMSESIRAGNTWIRIHLGEGGSNPYSG